MHPSLKHGLGVTFLLAWPAAVFLLHGSVGSWPLLLIGAALLIWRIPQARPLAALVGVGLIAVGMLGQAELGMRAYPVAVNMLMFCLFFASLLRGQSFIERLARLHEPDLPPAGVRYTRHITQVWCGFFVFNGLIAGWTALYADLAIWTLYNGLISYLLMGVLFTAEWLVRRRVRGVAA